MNMSFKIAFMRKEDSVGSQNAKKLKILMGKLTIWKKEEDKIMKKRKLFGNRSFLKDLLKTQGVLLKLLDLAYQYSLNKFFQK